MHFCFVFNSNELEWSVQFKSTRARHSKAYLTKTDSRWLFLASINFFLLSTQLDIFVHGMLRTLASPSNSIQCALNHTVRHKIRAFFGGAASEISARKCSTKISVPFWSDFCCLRPLNSSCPGSHCCHHALFTKQSSRPLFSPICSSAFVPATRILAFLSTCVWR